MILSLLLAGAEPAEFRTSPFVDADHQHEWKWLGEEDTGRSWWDRNSIHTRPVDGREHPAILIRHVANEDHWITYFFEYQDIIAAVDCDNNQFAEIDDIRNGQRVDDPWADVRPGPEFRPLPFPDTPEIQSMMRAVCGKDWTL